MKKLTISIVLAIIIQLNVSSQSCLPDGITFTTQAEIDNFQSNYPNCTEIEGFVEIHGTDIANLDGLDVLTSIGGFLRIEDNPALTSLAGMVNVTSIGGGLFIGDMNYGGNPSLTNLSGLDNLTSIWGDLVIKYNETLTTLTGLGNLTSVGANLDISDNAVLESLTELSNLTFIGGYLEIKYNSALTNLTGLNNVTSIGWDLSIMYNYSLVSLTGLENINPASITNLYIYENTFLTTCEVKSVCDYLANPNGGGIAIQYNNSGCNSQEEVEAACDEAWISEVNYKQVVTIYPNPAEKEISITSVNEIKIVEINIYNQLGNNVFNQKEYYNSIDISMLMEGIYILEFVIKEFKVREKLIIR